MAGPKNNLQDILSKRNPSASTVSSPAVQISVQPKSSKFKPVVVETSNPESVTNELVRKVSLSLPAFSTSGFGKFKPQSTALPLKPRVPSSASIICISDGDDSPGSRAPKRTSSDPSSPITSEQSSFKRAKKEPSGGKENSFRLGTSSRVIAKAKVPPPFKHRVVNDDIESGDEPWVTMELEEGDPFTRLDKDFPLPSLPVLSKQSPQNAHLDLAKMTTKDLTSLLLWNHDLYKVHMESMIKYLLKTNEKADIITLESIKEVLTARIDAINCALNAQKHEKSVSTSTLVSREPSPTPSTLNIVSSSPSGPTIDGIVNSQREARDMSTLRSNTHIISPNISSTCQRGARGTLSHDTPFYNSNSGNVAVVDIDDDYKNGPPESEDWWAQVDEIPLENANYDINLIVSIPSGKRTTTRETALATDQTNAPYYAEILNVLKNVFSLQSFRKNQLEAINATLAGRDVFVLMPTGGGKSLCYQLPALCRGGTTNGVTFIVSPLLALMQDQVQALIKKGVDVLLWNSERTPEDVQHIDLRLKGIKKPSMVYVTPEKLKESNHLKSILQMLYKSGELARFVIDEAHCISSWGRDFRDAYQELHSLRHDYPTIPIMALTATANRLDVQNIQSRLRMKDCVTLIQSFNRRNLRYVVETKNKGHKALESIAELIKKKYQGQSGVIYCLSRKTCEDVARSLREKYNLSAQHYHAKMDQQDKAQIQAAWQCGRCLVIVATIAFGMGIDKADVRFVIHHSLPKSLDGYYQETGRAGRDGKPADCILYYSWADAQVLINMIRNPDKDQARPHKAELERQEQGILRVVRYCQNVTDCRRRLVLGYFDEVFERRECGKTCDNCSKPGATIDGNFTQEAITAIRLVESLHGERVTLTQCANIFVGKNLKDLRERGHHNNRYFGAGKAMPPGLAESLFEYLLAEGAIYSTSMPNGAGWYNDYMAYKDCDAANSILYQGKEVRIGYRESSKLPRKNAASKS